MVQSTFNGPIRLWGTVHPNFVVFGRCGALQKRFRGVTGIFLALCWSRNVKNKLRRWEICWYHDRITMVNTVNYNGQYIITDFLAPQQNFSIAPSANAKNKPYVSKVFNWKSLEPWLRSGIKRTNGGCNDLYNFMLRRFYDHEFIFQHILEEIRINYPV